MKVILEMVKSKKVEAGRYVDRITFITEDMLIKNPEKSTVLKIFKKGKLRGYLGDALLTDQKGFEYIIPREIFNKLYGRANK